MIRNTRVLNAEGEKTGDFDGTEGPPDALFNPCGYFLGDAAISVIGRCTLHDV